MATFGSELVVISILKDLIFALRYELWIFGVRLEGPAYFFCDNRGAMKSMIIPE